MIDNYNNNNYYYNDSPIQFQTCLVIDVLGIAKSIGKNYIPVLTNCFLPVGLYTVL